MRTITKDITVVIDGNPTGFRLTRLDAFSGVTLLRLFMRLEGESPGAAPAGNAAGGEVADKTPGLTLLDLIISLSEEELRSVMTSVLNHVSVLLPAGPHPVMTGGEWGYPELAHDTPSCMKLLLEGISWSLSGFFTEGQSKPEPGRPDTAP